MRADRGTLTEPGKNCPFRDRPVDENLDLFRRMKAGEFPNGTRVLRAKIDMASGNINLRDPVLYRILHAQHPRTGTKWCDLSELRLCPRPVGRHRRHHPFDLHAGIRGPSAAVRVAASTSLPVPSKPRQYEFARLNLTYTLLSKRVLTQLVRDGSRFRLGRSAHADALPV